jgi:tetratricopeptide (TPR) repeat protein
VDGVLAHDPKNSLAWVRSSDIALARGDADAALSAALTAAELAPTSARAQIQAGIVHRARIRTLTLSKEVAPDSLHAEALAAFERAAKAEDDSLEHQTQVIAWVERANTLASWPSRRSEAPGAYREALAIATKLGASQDRALDAAIAYARAAKDDELLRWSYERSTEIRPDRVDLWRRLAKLSDPPDATRSAVLERLIAERPADARAQAFYARDLVQRGRTKDAIAHLAAVADKVKPREILLLAQMQLALDANDEATAKAAAARLAKEHSGSLEDRVAQSNLQRRARDFRAAADSLEGAIDTFGLTVPLIAELAELRLLEGDLGAALGATERGLSLSGTPLQQLSLLRLQSRAQLGRGAYEAAAASFRKMSDLGGGRVVTADLVPYSQALYAIGREAQGRKLLEIALALPEPPLDAVIMFARHEGARDPKRAEEFVAKALEASPHHPSLQEEAAGFDLAAGRNELAKKRLAAAIAAAPGFAPLYVTLARVQLQTGDAQAAIASADEAMRLEPDAPSPMAARVLVSAYAKLGKGEEAMKSLQASHAAGKLGIGGRVLLASLLTAQGQNEPAIALLEGITKDLPGNPGPKNDLAYLLVTSGRDLDRALSLAQEARAAMPNVSGVADTLGFAYLAKQLPDAALPQFEEAIGLAKAGSPEWGLAQLHRAVALKTLGRREDARMAAEAALTASEFPEQKQARALLQELARAATAS